MQDEKLQLTAELRKDVGKGGSRRLRHAEKVPAIIYGAGKKPQNITLEQKTIRKALENEDFFSQVITLNIGNKAEPVVLKDLQRHPHKPIVMHMDFLRIKATEKIYMHIPLHFIGEDTAPGVKVDGGVLSRSLAEVEIRCLPADLPKYIEVDVSNMQLNDTIHLSDLKLSQGVEIPALLQDEEHDQSVISLHAPKAVEEEETEAPEASEVEVITEKKGKEETGEAKE